MNTDAVIRLLGSPHNYLAEGNGLIVVGSGVPTLATVPNGLVYINTDGTDEDKRLYLRGDPAGDDWNAVLGGT